MPGVRPVASRGASTPALCGIGVIACAACTVSDDPRTAPDAAFPDAPARPDPGPALGTFELTYYWVADEADYTGVADTPLYDRACGVLAMVAAGFADAIRLEGTGRLVDGRLLNVAGACGCPRSPCYLEADADHPWGYGVQNRALVPFRSIAVDRDVIAYGTGVYVPDLDGRTMPGDPPWGAFVHDGCAIAADTGGSIVGRHVDLFVGVRRAYRELDAALAVDAVEVHGGGDRCGDEP
jgi:3D (Asp-Asp-Asp) domain-containing protein